MEGKQEVKLKQNNLFTKLIFAILVAVLILLPVWKGAAQNSTDSSWFHLSPEDAPFMQHLPVVLQPPEPPTARVNVPYFEENVSLHTSAIFWFGQVTSRLNYADVRIGYSPEELTVAVSIFDRLLYNDTIPSADDLLEWDSVSLMLETTGNREGPPSFGTYRFDGQVSTNGINLPEYQTAYQGSGGVWQQVNIDFETITGEAWESDSVGGINNGENNRGWLIIYHIPFTSLGLSGAPAEGTLWRMGLEQYDRESPTNPAVDIQSWPEGFNRSSLETWGELYFGQPGFTPPDLTVSGVATIRDGLNGVEVPDAGMGGTIPNLCPGDPNFIWNQWGETNYGSIEQFNVQNQGNLADWPCFSKYYVIFPLDQIPTGAAVLQAELSLYLFGNSDPSQARPSLIQVHEVNNSWQEDTITWNNAPQPRENIAATLVEPILEPPWDRVQYTWDVSRAAARAYAEGKPLRLALYSADIPMHSGKYFVSSEDAWVERPDFKPTLTIEWGSP